MQIIDTHTHLYLKEFDEDRDVLIQRAKSLGVQEFYLPSIDSSYYASMEEMEKNYPKEVKLMMGLHPTHVKIDFEKELSFVKTKLESREFAAIGEIGIDLYWDKSTLGIQQSAFRTQIQWAKQWKLPIVIHCRDAFDEIFEILEKEKSADLYGIFHCFTGTYEQAKRAINLGMKLGIGGVLTYKNGKIDQFLEQIDLKHLVLETDAPYLTPVPYRGKRNESAYLTYIVDKLALIYGISPKEIATQTTKNAREIFKPY